MCRHCKNRDKDWDEMPCADCEITEDGGSNFEPMNNYHRIKAMSIEELASFLCACSDCGNGRCYGNDLCKPGDGTCNGLVKYLESEASDARAD